MLLLCRSFMPSTLVPVDDSDLESIQYSNDPGWSIGGSENEFNHTTHGTQSASATATFVFNGTSVQIYGTIGPGSPAVFQSTDLPPGEHTLVMKVTVEGSWFWLDYILYTPFEEEETPGSTTSLSSIVSATRTTDTTRSTDTTHSMGITHSADTMSISTSSVAQGSSKSSAMPAIIGAAVGGVTAVLILGCLIAFSCYRSRRLKRRSTLAHEGAPTPFMLESADSRAVSLDEDSESHFLRVSTSAEEFVCISNWAVTQREWNCCYGGKNPILLPISP
ncbi:hypothetical protein BDZ89DRAFT_1160790 [Hymenopellis radicata]|nr:hypothetical protein BDZ89DRAFT_1160790 [Hymenopellis radicata]